MNAMIINYFEKYGELSNESNILFPLFKGDV